MLCGVNGEALLYQIGDQNVWKNLKSADPLIDPTWCGYDHGVSDGVEDAHCASPTPFGPCALRRGQRVIPIISKLSFFGVCDDSYMASLELRNWSGKHEGWKLHKRGLSGRRGKASYIATTKISSSLEFSIAKIWPPTSSLGVWQFRDKWVNQTQAYVQPNKIKYKRRIKIHAPPALTDTA